MKGPEVLTTNQSRGGVRGAGLRGARSIVVQLAGVNDCQHFPL